MGNRENEISFKNYKLHKNQKCNCDWNSSSFFVNVHRRLSLLVLCLAACQQHKRIHGYCFNFSWHLTFFWAAPSWWFDIAFAVSRVQQWLCSWICSILKVGMQCYSCVNFSLRALNAYFIFVLQIWFFWLIWANWLIFDGKCHDF